MSSVIKRPQINGQPILLKPPQILYTNQSEEVEADDSVGDAQLVNGDQSENEKSPAPALSEQELAEILHQQRLQAEADAQAIIRDAESYANEIITKANEDSARLREEAAQQGKDLGYQTGVAQGYAEVGAILLESNKMLDFAKSERQRILDSCEKDILELALAVAQRVIHTEITINTEIVMAVVKDAIQKAKDQDEIVLRVHPVDFETVIAEKAVIQAILGRELGLEIRGDIGIDAGGCVIETPYGAIDARIDSQLDTIQKALLGLVKHV